MATIGKLRKATHKIRDTGRSRRKASSSASTVSTATSGIRQDCHDWNKNRDFFRYTAGRFLFDEKKQMACRHVQFDMNELVHVAASSTASRACVAVRKLPEGQYNKAFLLTMDDGKRVIAKVPNPNAGRPHYTTASEVATMDFVCKIRTVLQLPTPKVYAWSSKAAENRVGAEFMIMEEARGVPLSHQWPTLHGDDKLNLIEKIVEIETTLVSTCFRDFGSLYYTKDLEHPARKDVLYTDATGRPTVNAQFAIGPTTDRKTCDNGRANIDFDRGPWTSAEGPLGIVNGPGLYQTCRDSKLSVLNDYLEVARYLLPADSTILRPCLWHNDLHSDNIFVNPEKPTEITGLIDWQSAHVGPLLMQAGHPSFLDFEGPKPEGIDAPSLPDDFDNLDEIEQERAKTLLARQSLFKAYEILSLQRNKKVYQALRHQKGLGCQIITFAGNLLQDGEPLVKGQLMQVQREWRALPAVRARDCPTCPLHFTPGDFFAQETDEAKWIHGLELMNRILESLGTVDRGWHGWVKAEDYALFKDKLDTVREQFLDQLSETAEDRPKWLSAWPFKD
ncbi:MAG: hypothetical protein Q9196_004636 [Gyalolechia fulgens]